MKLAIFVFLSLALPLSGQNLQEKEALSQVKDVASASWISPELALKKQSLLQHYRPLLIGGAAGFIFGAVIIVAWHLRQDDF